MCGAGEGVPNANFSQAWLAKNNATESVAPGLSNFLALKRSPAPAHATNGAVH